MNRVYGKKMGALLSGAIMAVLVGCAGGSKNMMNSSGQLPAAEGAVRAKSEDNGNTRVNVTVDHLAYPQAIADDASTYVVWARDPANGDVHNLGALQVGKDKQGELESITPLKQFDLFITAEPTASARYPSGDRALWTHVNAEN